MKWTPNRSTDAGVICDTVWPLIRISPESGLWIPARTLIMVDFPVPF